MEERSPLQRGWRGVFSPLRKKGGYMRSAGEDFIPYMPIFKYWEEDREAAKDALIGNLLKIISSPILLFFAIGEGI
jgi:hypothetical protein